MVIKNIELNTNCIDNIMNHIYETRQIHHPFDEHNNNEDEEEKKIMEDETDKNINTKTEVKESIVPDEVDIEILLTAYQHKFDSNLHLNKIKPYMNKVKIYSINQ